MVLNEIIRIGTYTINFSIGYRNSWETTEQIYTTYNSRDGRDNFLVDPIFSCFKQRTYVLCSAFSI